MTRPMLWLELKNDYYHSLKTWLRSQLGAMPGSHRDGQHKNKNGYYHNFKLDSRVDLRQGLSQRSKGQPSWPNFFKKNNQRNLILTIFFKKSTCFGPMFYPGSTWVFYQVRLSQSFLYFFKLGSVQALGWFGFRPICQVNPSFIIKIIIVLLILSLNKK